MEEYIKIGIGLVVSMITAIATYYITLRSNEAKLKFEHFKEQKYRFFYPFKFASNEFMHRLIHIEQRLSNPDIKHMKAHFQQNLENVDLDWFYTDWYNHKDVENLKPGGYFLCSTIYLNCILYQKIKSLLDEFPFIEVQFEKTLNDIIDNNTDLEQYYKSILNASDNNNRIISQLDKFKVKRKSLKVKEITENVRIATIMKNGIPYALQDSYGDFVTKDNKVINYDEFVKLLLDTTERKKFKQLIEFWTTLVDDDGSPDENKINKLRALIIFFTLIEETTM